MAPSDKKKAAPKADDPAAEAKQEDELKASLKRLNDAHSQLEEIRRAVHKMLQPLHSTSEPEMVYAAFADTAQKTVKYVKEFEDAMKDKKMQELLKSSKERFVKQENGSGWLGELNPHFDSWRVEQETGVAANKLDALKIERQATPKKG